MMLHEAVMLEIYRQALHASEMASPRCQSRESSSGGGRCPSDESIRSEGEREDRDGSGGGGANSGNSGLSPVSITLPPTLPPAAAAALLPQHSAAMAAYLNVAAVAAQQNRLLLGSPLAAGLAAAASRNGQSPPSMLPPLRSPRDEDADGSDDAALDFSKKSRADDDDDEDDDDEDDDAGGEGGEGGRGSRGADRDGGDGDGGGGGSDCGDAVNLSQKSGSAGHDNSPLDLSVGSHRKRTGHEEGGPGVSPPPRKTTRSLDYKPAIVTPWSTPVTPQLPYLAAAAVAAAGLSPKNNHHQHQLPHHHHHLQQHHQLDGGWNGGGKHGKGGGAGVTNDATKALEKMSELSRLGGEDIYRPPQSNSGGTGGGGGGTGGSGGRHSAWQSHWLNKGADSAKDVLKCVWCKQSFPSLAAMTTHMKETKHCGVNVPPATGGGHSQQSAPHAPSPQHHHHQQQQQQQQQQQAASQNQGGGGGGHGHGGHNQGSSKPSPSELNMLIKETMPLPRKLVRGQDVWLGKGAEQTRQILKCMWCGQSFRTLAEMTAHMQQTQHYTNIISQEQIISWKSSDSDKAGGPGAAGGTGAATGGGNGPAAGSGGGAGAGGPGGGGTTAAAAAAAAAAQTNSHVSAVLTCKVCDQAFSSLKELSNHMVKNAHYKEHIMRSITESGSRRRQTREKRKKSLPVRKLLEMERAQHDFGGGGGGAKNGGDGGPSAAAVAAAMGAAAAAANKPLRDLGAGKISCEKCGEKIETTLFVDHIRQCIGGTALLAAQQQREKLKSALLSNTILPPDSISPIGRDGRKSVSGDDLSSPLSSAKSPLGSDLLSPVSLLAKNTGPPKDLSTGAAGEKSSSPSVLNAIEQLIEKSFDTRSRHSSYGGGQGGQGGQGGPGSQGATTPLGSSILKRLGIDESVDYTKPLVDPQTMNLLRSYHHHHQQQQQQQNFQQQQQYGRRERSGSESSSISERGSSRLDSLTPEKKFDTPSHSTPRGTPEKPFLDGEDQVGVKRELHSDDETATREDPEPKPTTGKIRIKKELQEMQDAGDDQDREDREMRPPSKAQHHHHRELLHHEEHHHHPQHHPQSSPAPSPRLSTASVPLSPAASPLSDHHSIASRSTPGADGPSSSSSSTAKKTATSAGAPPGSVSSSLGALSSMFDSLTGSGGSGNGSADGTGGGGSGGGGGGKKSSAHPLAALQKLCDKTETPGGGGGRGGAGSSSGLLAATAGNGAGGSNTSSSSSRTAPGAILAFSWACNEGAAAAGDEGGTGGGGGSGGGGSGTLKCAYCDTTFSSKGAYRHHLSKAHFVNDDVIPDPKNSMAAATGSGQAKTRGSPSGGESPRSGGSNAPLSLVTSGGGGGGGGSSSSGASGRDSVERRGGPLEPAKSPPAAQSPAGFQDESPHSKFLKYTELAKQLSSKYV
ncbi:protein tiptop [Anopheles cruzii]|uniref:protein tiptop n=1 Tax=Anopheles cruzii TaxID=68878 RepID=UPI0022EC18D0|nr:protein tiptop [Anopheles cruzii]